MGDLERSLLTMTFLGSVFRLHKYRALGPIAYTALANCSRSLKVEIGKNKKLNTGCNKTTYICNAIDQILVAMRKPFIRNSLKRGVHSRSATTFCLSNSTQLRNLKDSRLVCKDLVRYLKIATSQSSQKFSVYSSVLQQNLI